MSKGLILWLLMIIWFIFAMFAGWNRSQPGSPAYSFAETLLLFAVVFLLGWAVFGFIVQ